MNIFHLDKDPILCARWLCDKHCVKMVLETAQMLCTAYQRQYGIKDDLYKPAYPNHPMTKWVGNSGENFFFTIKLFGHLADEYQYRYNKIHLSSKTILLLHSKYKEWHSWKTPFTNPPLCMPDEYKTTIRIDEDNATDEFDYIESYRKYYIGAKKYMAKYNYSEPPHWIGELNAR